ncbi:hypothetical protein FB451DRAFT_1369631 [Mycena latifolia]|nr:hypothetical protein FB451DRAFT_1369631 [Mycena latifolia]
MVRRQTAGAISNSGVRNISPAQSRLHRFTFASTLAAAPPDLSPELGQLAVELGKVFPMVFPLRMHPCTSLIPALFRVTPQSASVPEEAPRTPFKLCLEQPIIDQFSVDIAPRTLRANWLGALHSEYKPIVGGPSLDQMVSIGRCMQEARSIRDRVVRQHGTCGVPVGKIHTGVARIGSTIGTKPGVSPIGASDWWENSETSSEVSDAGAGGPGEAEFFQAVELRQSPPKRGALRAQSSVRHSRPLRMVGALRGAPPPGHSYASASARSPWPARLDLEAEMCSLPQYRFSCALHLLESLPRLPLPRDSDLLASLRQSLRDALPQVNPAQNALLSIARHRTRTAVAFVCGLRPTANHSRGSIAVRPRLHPMWRPFDSGLGHDWREYDLLLTSLHSVPRRVPGHALPPPRRLHLPAEPAPANIPYPIGQHRRTNLRSSAAKVLSGTRSVFVHVERVQEAISACPASLRLVRAPSSAPVFLSRTGPPAFALSASLTTFFCLHRWILFCVSLPWITKHIKTFSQTELYAPAMQPTSSRMQSHVELILDSMWSCGSMYEENTQPDGNVSVACGKTSANRAREIHFFNGIVQAAELFKQTEKDVADTLKEWPKLRARSGDCMQKARSIRDRAMNRSRSILLYFFLLELMSGFAAGLKPKGLTRHLESRDLMYNWDQGRPRDFGAAQMGGPEEAELADPTNVVTSAPKLLSPFPRSAHATRGALLVRGQRRCTPARKPDRHAARHLRALQPSIESSRLLQVSSEPAVRTSLLSSGHFLDASSADSPRLHPVLQCNRLCYLSIWSWVLEAAVDPITFISCTIGLGGLIDHTAGADESSFSDHMAIVCGNEYPFAMFQWLASTKGSSGSPTNCNCPANFDPSNGAAAGKNRTEVHSGGKEPGSPGKSAFSRRNGRRFDEKSEALRAWTVEKFQAGGEMLLLNILHPKCNGFKLTSDQPEFR